MVPKIVGVPGEIRTHDPRIRNPVLYPTELRGRRQPRVILASRVAQKGQIAPGEALRGASEWRRFGRPTGFAAASSFFAD